MAPRASKKAEKKIPKVIKTPVKSKSKNSDVVSTKKNKKNHEDFEVEYILHRVAINRKLHFLIKWKNYPYKDCTFVEDKHVSARDLYDQYLKSLDYKWEDVGAKKLLEIDGHFEWEDEKYVFGVFEGAPQPILMLTKEAKPKFALVRKYFQTLAANNKSN